jgi:hypothetical protein
MKNEVYSKITRSELIKFVKELLSHFQTRSKELKELKERYVMLLKLHETTLMDMENIEAENRYFKQLTDKWSKKPLSEDHIALQEFIVTALIKSKLLLRFISSEGTREKELALLKSLVNPILLFHLVLIVLRKV